MEVVDCIHCNQGKEHRQVLVNTVVQIVTLTLH